MTVRSFADTNIIVYAQSADGDKTIKAVAVLEALEKSAQSDEIDKALDHLRLTCAKYHL